MYLLLAVFHWDACGQGQGVSLAVALRRDDFQGCSQLHIRALWWEGSLCLSQTLLLLSLLQLRRLFHPGTGSWAAGSFLFSLPRAEGELGIFRVNVQPLVSCCFSFPIVWKRAFPCLGQQGGDFPSMARLYIAASGEV